jgi:hypothetical protein
MLKTILLCRSISSHPVVFSIVSPLSIGANEATMLGLSKIVTCPEGGEAGNTTAEKGTLQRATEHDKLRDGAGHN